MSEKWRMRGFQIEGLTLEQIWGEVAVRLPSAPVEVIDKMVELITENYEFVEEK
jgi:hypothetical protein